MEGSGLWCPHKNIAFTSAVEYPSRNASFLPPKGSTELWLSYELKYFCFTHVYVHGPILTLFKCAADVPSYE